MKINDIKIEELIPQRNPFIMIDCLTESNEHSTTSIFYIKEDNLFVENGLFLEAGLIENIAQTSAARSGYFNYSEKKVIDLGYIGSVKNFEVFELPKVGEILRTEVCVVNQIFNVNIIKGTIHSTEKLIASCELKIFINV